MSEYNLLIENWIPVQKNQKISLKELLCKDQQHSLALDRDDMELACLQMLVCIVQVIFTPNDLNDLEDSYNNSMKKEDYDKATSKFKDWFDLLHPQYPFMQTDFELDNDKEKSLQKLLIGLPEKSSSSQSSEAHFHRTDEVKEMDLGEAAIALFQQATNGFGLGGSFFKVGLKGSRPLTTLVYDESKDLRKTIWCNILHKEFLRDKNIMDVDGNEKMEDPAWVKSISFDKEKPEFAHQIGLMRGLFWQPAKVKLVVNADQKATGFFTENGLSCTKNYWLHPHTPIDMKKIQDNDEKKKPYMSLSSSSKDMALWTKMLSFLYTNSSEEEGHTRALVVDAYLDGIGRGKPLNLAVGGYIKGKSTESLFARKHEMYSLKPEFNDRYAEMKELVDCALKAQSTLNTSIYFLGQNLKWGEKKNDKGQEKSNFIKKSLQPKAQKIYFNNSELLMHETLRTLDFQQIQKYKDKFCQLAKTTFEEVTQPYEHDPKFIKAIEKGRSHLFRKLQQQYRVQEV